MVLSSFDNLGKVLDQDRASPLKYGSECRSPKELHYIFKLRSLWNRSRKILDEYIDFPLEHLGTKSRKLLK